MLWGGGALQLLEHAVSLDAARNDDGGGDAEPLAREVDLLGRLRTLELVNLKRVTIDTAKGSEGWGGDSERVGVSMGADSARKRTLWGSSALEMGDHRLLEDGSERGGALNSDGIVPETAWGGWRQ
jgi:hypothetical protein